MHKVSDNIWYHLTILFRHLGDISVVLLNLSVSVLLVFFSCFFFLQFFLFSSQMDSMMLRSDVVRLLVSLDTSLIMIIYRPTNTAEHLT